MKDSLERMEEVAHVAPFLSEAKAGTRLNRSYWEQRYAVAVQEYTDPHRTKTPDERNDHG